jgi:hypothetical protein
MTIKNETMPGVARYTHVVDIEQLRPQIETLVDEVVSSSLGHAAFAQALASGMEETASSLRAVPATEGRMLERGIELIANRNPDLVVIADKPRLPVSKMAVELVAMNDPRLVSKISLDADSGGRKTYTPDLVIANRARKIAHVIDVKRSLASYEASRIKELTDRMQAASAVVSDLLYRDYHRLYVNDVRVVILNAENQRTNLDGVWPLSSLDHLLEITGAGQVMTCLRELFQRRVEANWSAALSGHGSRLPAGVFAETTAIAGTIAALEDDPDALTDIPRIPVSIGLARLPRITVN